MSTDGCCILSRLYDLMDVGKCGGNDKQRKPNTGFAALDSHISNMELPTIKSDSMYGTNVSEFGACVKPTWCELSTIIAVIGSYSNVANLILFNTEDDHISDLLELVSSRRLHSRPGVTVSVTPILSHEHMFKITIFEANRILVVSESKMISMVSELSQYDMSLVMYLYDGSEGYSAVVTPSEKSMWISCASNTMAMVGSTESRLMPKFFSAADVGSVLRINVGPGVAEIQKDRDKIQLQLNSLSRWILSGRSKFGECYYCAYLNRIHSSVCKNKEDTAFSATLIDKFRVQE